MLLLTFLPFIFPLGNQRDGVSRREDRNLDTGADYNLRKIFFFAELQLSYLIRMRMDNKAQEQFLGQGKQC
jgi:hypothetical protein